MINLIHLILQILVFGSFGFYLGYLGHDIKTKEFWFLLIFIVLGQIIAGLP